MTDANAAPDYYESESEDPIPANPNHVSDVSSTTGSAAPPTPPCTIYITSLGHRFGPYTAPPDAASTGALHKPLQYDLRAFPNPPKTVRAQQTGLHKALREWFFSHPEASTKLEAVCAEICAAASEVYESRPGPGGKVDVVVFCEMGRHRSVAFVEELRRRDIFVSTKDGAEKCHVVAHHRDVARGRDAQGRRRRFDARDLS
ncbi:hypothetical protein GGX14DRAFT_432369 [Mycena pura]|uniref:RapZ C-terminal domain-containing protein n=1 Tax=Mycena pura TaxID=153505 RepID=A0AAD6VS19_9AGAR|nr:hypothetical protein GGX14DRAFT_432369 [Mycena pura]